MLTEEVYLVEHGLFVKDFRKSGREHLVPEQGYLFLKRPLPSVGVHTIYGFG